MNRGKMERFALLRRQGKKQAITVGKARHSPVVVLDRYLLQGKGAVLLLQRLPGRKPNAEKLAWLVAAAGSRQAKPLPHPAHGGLGLLATSDGKRDRLTSPTAGQIICAIDRPGGLLVCHPVLVKSAQFRSKDNDLACQFFAQILHAIAGKLPDPQRAVPYRIEPVVQDHCRGRPIVDDALLVERPLRALDDQIGRLVAGQRKLLAEQRTGSAKEPRHVRAWRVDRLPDRLRVRQESAPDQDRFPLLSSLPSAQPRPNRLRPSAVIIDRCESEVFA